MLAQQLRLPDLDSTFVYLMHHVTNAQPANDSRLIGFRSTNPLPRTPWQYSEPTLPFVRLTAYSPFFFLSLLFIVCATSSWSLSLCAILAIQLFTPPKHFECQQYPDDNGVLVGNDI